MTREEAIKQLESLYDHCQSMKSGDDGFPVWEDDCDDCKALKLALAALRPVSREQVEKVWRGEWTGNFNAHCSLCGAFNTMAYIGQGGNFCSACGAPTTDEAVEMVMKSMEALYD